MEFHNIIEEMIYVKKRNQFIKELELFIELRGYMKVDVDFFEPYNTFIAQNNRIKQETMIKVIDPKGKLSLLRPDITTNIIKQVVYKWVDGAKVKLYYDADIFRQEDGVLTGKRQLGIEQLGYQDLTAETDVLQTVIDVLEEYSISYNIRLGNAAFTSTLLNNLGWSKVVIDEIKNALQAKNQYALKQSINGQTSDTQSSELLLNLLSFEGPLEDVLEMLSSYQLSKALQNALNDLKTVVYSLKNQTNVWIDLSLIPEYDYYNGLVLEGYAKGIPTPLFQGGRYDTLTKQYGKDINAFGVSFDYQRLIEEVTKDE